MVKFSFPGSPKCQELLIISHMYCGVLILVLSSFYLYVLGDGSLIREGSFMQTKHLCVLMIHIRIKGKVGTVKLV